MATRIQIRRDTAANWASANPVLTAGEPAFETDTGKTKYGDGTTAWNSLAYAGIRSVASAVSSSGTLANNAHTPASAAGGAISLALPTGRPQGSVISVEKTDASLNAISITGNIRGAAGQTISLALYRESIDLIADSAGAWWPFADHKTLSSVANLAVPPLTNRLVAFGHSYLTGGGVTHIDRQLIALLAGMWRSDLRDLAVGGSEAGNDEGWKGSSTSKGGWAWVRQNITTYRTSAPDTPATFLPFLMTGLNDLTQHHADANARAVFVHALRAHMSWLCQSRVYDDTDASIAYGGANGWAARIPSTLRNSGAGYRAALTNGATFTITLPADFEGGSVAVDLIAFPAGDGQITWSGSASQLPATTNLSGVAYASGGSGGQRDSSNGLVARITGLTASDAGKTIIGTYGSGGGTRVSTPPAPGTPTTGGTAGAATYTYARVYRYFNGETVLSSTTSIATGNATLSGTNNITIPAGPAWPAGVEAEAIIRTAGGTTPGQVQLWLTTGPQAIIDNSPVASGGAYTPNPVNPLTGGFAVDGWHIESNTPVTRGVVCNLATLPAAHLTAQGLTTTDFTNWNSDIAGVVAEFTANQWKIVDTDAALGGNAAYFNPSPNVHPNDRGHAVLAAKIFADVNSWSAGIALADQAMQSRSTKRVTSRALTDLRYNSTLVQGAGANYTVTTGGWADVDASLLSWMIDAQPGDDIEFTLAAASPGATAGGLLLDIGLFDSGGTLIRYGAASTGTPTTPGIVGWPTWYAGANTETTPPIQPISGSCVFTIQPSDLAVLFTVQGVVFAKLRAQATGASRTLYAGGFNSPPLQMHVKNLGQRNTPGVNAS